MEGFGSSEGAPYRVPDSGQGVCALHESVIATGTCSRCGNYVCAECTGWGTYDTCPSCRERLGIDQFPFTRDGWTIGGLLDHAWQAFKRDWAALVGVTLIVFVVQMATSFLAMPIGIMLQKDQSAYLMFSVVNQVFQTLVSLTMTLGAMGVFLTSVRGRPITAASFFDAVRNLGKALVQDLLLGLVAVVVLGAPIAVLVVALLHHEEAMMLSIAGFLFVAVVPLIYVGLGLMFMQYELVNDAACGPIEAIRRSWALARGQRLYLFGVSLVSLLIMFAGVLVCCVGMLVSYPIGLLLTAGAYLAVRNGSGLPIPTARVRL